MTMPPGGWFVHLVATYEDNSINKASVLLGIYKIAFWQDAVNRRIIVRMSGNLRFVLFCLNFWGEGLAAIISALDSRMKNIYGALKTQTSQIGLFSSHWMFSCHCGAFLLKVMWSEGKLRVLRKRLKCEYFTKPLGFFFVLFFLKCNILVRVMWQKNRCQLFLELWLFGRLCSDWFAVQFSIKKHSVKRRYATASWVLPFEQLLCLPVDQRVSRPLLTQPGDSWECLLTRVVKKQITDTFNLRLKFYARVWISYFKIVILINIKQLCFLNEPMIKILNVNETN